MENLLDETSLEIVIELGRLGIQLGTWEQDVIRKILTASLGRAFEQGRSTGLRDVLALLEVHGLEYVKKL